MAIVEIVTICASIIAIIISLATAVFVYLQVNFMKRQMQNDATARMIESNREIIALGIQDEDIWNVLEGKHIESKIKEKRFAQLWINQISLGYYAWANGVIDKNLWSSMREDIRQTMRIPALRERYRAKESLYQDDFRKFINSLLDDKE